MATIKAYTDIEQSRKLAKILPIESADMRYQAYYDNMNNLKHIPRFVSTIIPLKADIPCWSLTALLNISPNGIVMNKDSQNGRYHFSSKYIGTYVTADNSIDACVELILKLHELNLS